MWENKSMLFLFFSLSQKTKTCQGHPKQGESKTVTAQKSLRIHADSMSCGILDEIPERKKGH